MRADRGGELLTRLEAAHLLGVSKERIRGLERQKRLVPVFDRDAGEWLHSRAEIIAYGKERKRKLNIGGELAALLFAHFEAGTPFARIVIETKQTPEIVVQLHEQYKRGLDDAPPPAKEDKSSERLAQDLEDRWRARREHRRATR
jgi:hypothetical protein